MIRGDEDWLSITDAFYTAAVDGKGWDAVVGRLATATGSRGGQLIGFSSGNTVPFNWVSGVGKEWSEDFLAHGGGDPRANPNLRAGMAIAPLKVLASADFVTHEERRTNAFLNDWAARHDTPYICLSPLIKDKSLLVGLAVLRSHKQGEISRHERAVFSSIAPHVQASVRMQMALEHQGARMMADVLEAFSRPVFICDGMGKVRAMTAAAEALVMAGDTLRLKQGVLGTSSPDETHALTRAINKATHGLHQPGAPLLGAVPLKSKNSRVLALDVFPLPRREYGFGFEPRALVVVRGTRSDFSHTKCLLQTAYGLTAAEVEVALQVFEGLSPEAIAEMRRVSIGTIRSQLRSIYDKLGVNRLSELVSRLIQFY